MADPFLPGVLDFSDASALFGSPFQPQPSFPRPSTLNPSAPLEDILKRAREFLGEKEPEEGPSAAVRLAEQQGGGGAPIRLLTGFTPGAGVERPTPPAAIIPPPPPTSTADQLARPKDYVPPDAIPKVPPQETVPPPARPEGTPPPPPPEDPTKLPPFQPGPPPPPLTPPPIDQPTLPPGGGGGIDPVNILGGAATLIDLINRGHTLVNEMTGTSGTAGTGGTTTPPNVGVPTIPTGTNAFSFPPGRGGGLAEGGGPGAGGEPTGILTTTGGTGAGPLGPGGGSWFDTASDWYRGIAPWLSSASNLASAGMIAAGPGSNAEKAAGTGLATVKAVTPILQNLDILSPGAGAAINTAASVGQTALGPGSSGDKAAMASHDVIRGIADYGTAGAISLLDKAIQLFGGPSGSQFWADMFHLGPSLEWKQFPEKISASGPFFDRELGGLSERIAAAQSPAEIQDLIAQYKTQIAHGVDWQGDPAGGRFSGVGGYGVGSGPYDIPELPASSGQAHGIDIPAPPPGSDPNEIRQGVGDLEHAQLANLGYANLLGRRLTKPELSPYLTMTPDDIYGSIASSPERAQRVGDLYKWFLGREGQPSEASGYGTQSIADIVKGMQASPERLSDISRLYQTELGRPGTAPEWTPYAQSMQSLAQIQKGIQASPEGVQYAARPPIPYTAPETPPLPTPSPTPPPMPMPAPSPAPVPTPPPTPSPAPLRPSGAPPDLAARLLAMGLDPATVQAMIASWQPVSNVVGAPG